MAELSRLRASEGPREELRTWLEEEQERVRTLLMTETEPAAFYRAQGRAKLLVQLLQLTDEEHVPYGAPLAR